MTDWLSFQLVVNESRRTSIKSIKGVHRSTRSDISFAYITWFCLGFSSANAVGPTHLLCSSHIWDGMHKIPIDRHITTLGTDLASNDILCLFFESIAAVPWTKRWGSAHRSNVFHLVFLFSIPSHGVMQHLASLPCALEHRGNLREIKPQLRASSNLRGNITFSGICPWLNQAIGDNGFLCPRAVEEGFQSKAERRE